MNARVVGGWWVVDCLDCDGCGVFEVYGDSWACVPCKGTGYAVVCLARPVPSVGVRTT